MVFVVCIVSNNERKKHRHFAIYKNDLNSRRKQTHVIVCRFFYARDEVTAIRRQLRNRSPGQCNQI